MVAVHSCYGVCHAHVLFGLVPEDEDSSSGRRRLDLFGNLHAMTKAEES